MPRHSDNAASFRTLVLSPVKFRLFMLARLPLAYLVGLCVTTITPQRSTVRVPYKYLNKNPFQSIYFACLSMAAELSTGVLCMAQVYKSVPAVSMLVVRMEADYSKKAVGTIAFTCYDGKAIARAAEQAKATGEGVTVVANSIGVDESGDEVATFRFTWSLKAKRN